MSPIESSSSTELQETICQFAEEFSSCHTPFNQLNLDSSLRVVEIIDTLRHTEDPVKSISELIDKIKTLDPIQYATNPLYTFITRFKTPDPKNVTSKEIATESKVKKILEEPENKRNEERLASLLADLYKKQGPSNTFVLREFQKLTVKQALTLLEGHKTRALAVKQIEMALALSTDSLRHDPAATNTTLKSIRHLISKDPTIFQKKCLRPFIGELYEAIDDKAMKSYIRQIMRPKYNFSASFKLDWPYARA